MPLQRIGRFNMGNWSLITKALKIKALTQKWICLLYCLSCVNVVSRVLCKWITDVLCKFWKQVTLKIYNSFPQFGYGSLGQCHLFFLVLSSILSPSTRFYLAQANQSFPEYLTSTFIFSFSCWSTLGVRTKLNLGLFLNPHKKKMGLTKSPTTLLRFTIT